MARRPRPMKLVKPLNSTVSKHSNAHIEQRERNEPQIKSVVLACPQRLSPAAAEEWARITTLYKEFDDPIMTDLDEDVLVVYCEALIVYKTAMDKVKETAAVYKSPKDQEPRINPWLKVANDASEIMRKHSDLLLLNPVSRARVGLARVKAEEQDINPMARFLKERMKHD